MRKSLFGHPRCVLVVAAFCVDAEEEQIFFVRLAKCEMRNEMIPSVSRCWYKWDLKSMPTNEPTQQKPICVVVFAKSKCFGFILPSTALWVFYLSIAARGKKDQSIEVQQRWVNNGKWHWGKTKRPRENCEEKNPNIFDVVWLIFLFEFRLLLTWIRFSCCMKAKVTKTLRPSRICKQKWKSFNVPSNCNISWYVLIEERTRESHFGQIWRNCVIGEGVDIATVDSFDFICLSAKWSSIPSCVVVRFFSPLWSPRYIRFDEIE